MPPGRLPDRETTKTQNKLSPECADKLQYIYMNSRTLAKQKILQPTDEELLKLEEDFSLFTQRWE